MTESPMDAEERFALAAAAFERWVILGTDRGPDAAREALIQVLRLYICGLDLPDAWSDEVADGSDGERLADEQWRIAVNGCARLPLNLYSVRTLLTG